MSLVTDGSPAPFVVFFASALILPAAHLCNVEDFSLTASSPGSIARSRLFDVIFGAFVDVALLSVFLVLLFRTKAEPAPAP